jgi:adenosylmethionine-8-amino-7-oxononanoate aminotransferase
VEAWQEIDREHVWHALSGRRDERQPAPLLVDQAEGVWVFDDEGRRYLDAMAGLWCVNAGYGREEIARAAYDELRARAYAPLSRAHPRSVQLAAELDGLLGGGWSMVFSNSGSEANEAAFKIARQYHTQRGESSRWKIISRYRAYHGQTLGALGATGQAQRKFRYEPLTPGFLHVMPPDPYRYAGEEDLDAYGRRCARDLEDKIVFELAETVAAVIMEPIITGGGMLIPPDSYLPAVADICRRHGVLLIIDEVICGFGRTGHWFGFEYAGIRPDMIAMAKGLTSGYFPLSATAVREEIFAAFPARGNERFRHINTFGGHPAGCAVALANLNILRNENLVERAARVGERLVRDLERLHDSPLVGDVRGRGLLAGIELVSDKTTRRPAADAQVVAAIAACARRGVLIGRNADTIAGLDNVLTLAPPLILDEEQAGMIVDVLEESLAEVAQAEPAGITLAPDASN